jgi:glycosyltransferase involved in cell wall biosynthesis
METFLSHGRTAASSATSVQGLGRVVFINWTPQARGTALGQALGEAYTPAPRLQGKPWPVRYAAQALLTLAFLVRRRPDHVLFTNPPFIVGSLLLVLSRLLGFSVWCDAHSGAFDDPRWSRFARANAKVLRSSTGVVVANEPLAARLREQQLNPVVVISPPLIARPSQPSAARLLVATLGYSFDEPLQELLEAVRLVPDIRVVFTGRAPTWVRESAPANCALTGWLTAGDYDQLLREARGVICLTTREATMQTGAYEAVERGLPMILSATRMLREYFDLGGTIFVEDHTPERLAKAMRQVVDNQTKLRQESIDARDIYVQRSRDQFLALRAALAAMRPRHGTC